MKKFSIKIAMAMSFFLFIGITTNAATVVETQSATITILVPDVTTGQTGDITHDYPSYGDGPCYPNGSSCIIRKSLVKLGLAEVSKLSPERYILTFQVTSVTYLYLINNKEVSFDGNNVKLPGGLMVHIDKCGVYPELEGKKISIGEPTTNSEGYFVLPVCFE